MSRAIGWLAVVASGQWAMIDETGAEHTGNGFLQCLVDTYEAARDYLVLDSEQLLLLLNSLPAKGRPDSTIIHERAGAASACGGFSFTHGASYWLGAMLFPDPVRQYCAAAGWPQIPRGDAMDMVRVWRQVYLQQQQLVRDVCGIEPGRSLAGTAVRAVLPEDWRNGADFFKASAAYACIRSACYGGRIECYQPGFAGEAVEYDLRSAYGWALTQPLPDWQVYQRRAYWAEAEWLECTVRVDGPVGPLPIRADDDVRSLSWPRDGVHRGWWTAEDLDKRNARVLQIHDRYAGRFTTQLSPSVQRWLYLRESSKDQAVRDTIRALAVSFAGKLWQRPQSWDLWHMDDGPAPNGSVVLGQTNWLVYQTSVSRPVLSLPTTASWITALVRSKVWPHIANGEAIYTHTDSVHVPVRADGLHIIQTGMNPGDWSIKESGFATYRGVNDYRIGKKVVRAGFSR